MQAAIVSVMDKKGNKAFKELIDKLGGTVPETSTEPAAPSGKKRRAAPHVPPAKGKRDPRLPKPVKRQTPKEAEK